MHAMQPRNHTIRHRVPQAHAHKLSNHTNCLTYQNTLPQERQWCLRLNSENADAQWEHSDTISSGTHSGDVNGFSFMVRAADFFASGDANSCRPYLSCVFTLVCWNTLSVPGCAVGVACPDRCLRDATDNDDDGTVGGGDMGVRPAVWEAAARAPAPPRPLECALAPVRVRAPPRMDGDKAATAGELGAWRRSSLRVTPCDWAGEPTLEKALMHSWHTRTRS